MRRRRIGGTLLALALATAWVWPASSAMAGGGGGCYAGATQGEGDTVEMSKMCFRPSVLQVDPGTEVTFVNQDPITHNVSATGWGSDADMQDGDSFAATFAEEGTFPYACMYHYGMTGAIVVGDGAGPGTGKPIEVSAVSTTPLSQEVAGGQPASNPRQASSLGWVVAGAAGLIVGALGVGLIRRRKEI